ncbi:hypothetical protein [Streptomyces sp. NPDC057966]
MRAPHWRPAALAEVTDQDVDGFFAPRGEHGLHLAVSDSTQEVPW